MAMQIVAEVCTACGDCEPVCPTGAIHTHKGVYAIKSKDCTECEDQYDFPQCEDICEIDDCVIPLDS